MNYFDLIIVPDREDSEAAEILVEGKISGREYRFLLDTGAAKTKVISDEYTSSFQSSGTDESSGAFNKCTNDLIKVANVEIGPIWKKEFTIVRAAKNNTDARNLLGMDILRDYCCVFFL